MTSPHRPAVLDASVFIASESVTEHHHAAALALLRTVPPDEPFLVPSVFVVEVASALARRGTSRERMDTVLAHVAGPRFAVYPVEDLVLKSARELAATRGLRAYDAIYAALAIAHSGVLLTFDGDVERRLADSHPGLVVSAIE